MGFNSGFKGLNKTMKQLWLSVNFILLNRMLSDKFCFGSNVVQYDILVGGVQGSSVQCNISDTVNSILYV